MKNEVVRLDNVTCLENGITQLHQMNFQIFEGEVMGLVALNHHGIETLLRLLQQNVPIHFGRIYFRERLVNSHFYCDPDPNAVAVIARKSCLIEGLTVSDNLFVLGHPDRRWIVRPHSLRRRLYLLEQELDVELPADSYVENLTFFQRCLAELFRAILNQCTLIVLQDVSHYMDGSDLGRLHDILRRLAGKGYSFLYISNNQHEIANVCDRSAVMQNGEIVKVFEDGVCSDELLKRRLQAAQIRPENGRRGPDTDAECFSVGGLSSGTIQELSFSVAPGECLLLHGADESFLTEFRAIVSGEKCPEHGTILLNGTPVRGTPTRYHELAYLSENAADHMLFPELDYLNNLTFSLERVPFWKRPAVLRSLRRELGEALGNVFDIPVGLLDVEQRFTLLFYRILLQKPRVVLWERPLFGADYRLRQHILSLIQRLLERRIAIVVLATGVYEAFPLADRVQGLPEREEEALF